MNKELSPDASAVLDLAVDIGKSMVKCGSEINRVEETIIRICAAYNLTEKNVFSIVSMVIATVTDADGNTHTRMKRVYSYSANFDRLDQLNQLSRELCSGNVTIDEGRKIYESIFSQKRKFRPLVLLGSIIAAASFTIFFGGGVREALCAGFIAVPVYFIGTFIHHRRINRLFFTALNSLVAGTLALTFARIGLCADAAVVMIGDIMLLIPGLWLVNSFRELLCGDVVSGGTRLLDCIMISLAVACGFAVPILAFSFLFG